MRRLLLLLSTALIACTAAGDVAGTGPERDSGSGGGRGGSDVRDRGGDDAGDEPDSTAIPDAVAADSGATDVATTPDSATPDSDLPDVSAADTAPADVFMGPAGHVSGTVWAPGNAPGMVPAGQEIPISGALVYLSETRPEPIPQNAYCEACTSTPSRAVLTDARGNFELLDRAAGAYWLVIQKGQFRREVEIVVEPEVTLAMPTEQTTFPSVHDPDNGAWIPRIALASGSYDHLEDILGKLGIGSVNADGSYNTDSAAGHIDVWSNGGRGFAGAERGSIADLVGDLDNMLQYHIIFIPCSGDSFTSALRDANVLRNIRAYVAAGGNLYVTDWSGEWHDNVFPAFITLGGFGTDTPATAFNASTESWVMSRFGSADGDAYDSNDGNAVDPALHAWLDGQRGPTADSDTISAFNASRFLVEGNWNTITATTRVQVGVDGGGTPIYNEPRVYVTGSPEFDLFSPGPKPLTVTYEPAGCGRVLFSTYHTTDDTHVGLAPQERVLVYLIMEIGTCRNPKA
jgi:hypothetical protein